MKHHRTMAEVQRYEAQGCYCELPHLNGHMTTCPVWKQIMRLPRERRG